MRFEQANRIKSLPPYLFARIEQKIAEKKEAGVDIVSLGIGDPDLPTPKHIIARLEKEARIPANHQYPSSAGMLSFREAVSKWYEGYYQVKLDPAREVVTLIGSKEGIAQISMCYLNPGDIALVPDPGYPVYAGGTLLAGGEPYYMPLTEENDFLPDLAAIPKDIAQKAKIMFLNYPNNPTGAVASVDFFRKVVEFAKKYNILVCHDNSYGLIAFDGYKPPSFLQIPGAMDVGIEFSSLSKPYNMTGWRIGWAAGNAEVVDALTRLKSNIDSGAFQAVQHAAIAGLTGSQDGVAEICEVYRRRRDKVVDTLNDMGWNLEKPKAAFYVWAPVPPGYTSESFSEMILEKAGVVVTQGNGYGRQGEGFFRISLTIDDDRLEEALKRLVANVVKVEF